MSRASQPTLEDIRERSTEPAPPSLTPVVHEAWLELLRHYTDLTAVERELLTSIADCLRRNPLRGDGERGRWVLEVRVGGVENFRSGAK